MNEIIQTEVDEEKVCIIDNRIAVFNVVIENTNKKIETLLKEKKKLQTTYFCGMEIGYEREEKGYDERNHYELTVEVNNDRVRARAYTDARDHNIFVANLEGGYEINDIKFNIKTFDEAKQICRQWLADLIYDKKQENDKNNDN